MTKGYAPFEVQFNDSSVYATSWNWDFGDGKTSNVQNPMHLYSAAGTYTVNLTASNPNGTSSTYATIVVLKRTAFPVYAYITNAGNNTVSVIDTSNNTVTATVPVGLGPWGVAVTPDGTKVYVANMNSSTVSVIDTSTNTVTATVPVGSMPWGIAITQDGTKAYVTNSADNTISVIDISTNTVITTVPVGQEPWGVVVTPDGKKVYVADDKVSVIDTSTNTVTAAVPGGGWANEVAVNPAGTKVYATNGNTVSVIDTSTNTVIATVPVGDNPIGVAVTPDGTKVYVASPDSGTVYVIDTAANKVIATVPVESDPVGVSITPDGMKVYITNSGSNTVSVIDTITNTVTATVPVGISPNSVGQFIVPSSLHVTNFSTNVTSGYIPLSVQFNDSSENATGWFWNFGDGSSSIEQNPVHTYSTSGTYNAFLVVNNGNSYCSKTVTIKVLENVPPVARFSSNVTRDYVPLSVRFTDLSENTIEWNWDFGDGSYSTEQNPMHVYSAAGNYTVNLTVSNAYGTNTSFSNITVLELPAPPVANFSASLTSGYAPLDVQFNDSSENATSWNWDFGDGANSNEQNPEHTYSTAGNYTVKQTVSNMKGSSSKTTAINVSAPLGPYAGPFAYIPNSGSNDVSVIDTAINAVIATVHVGSCPYGATVTPDGRKAYVANFYSNTVSVIDTATNTVIAALPVGQYPVEVGVNPDGKKVYVTNYNDGTISVIDTSNNTVTATVPVGNEPIGIAISPDGSKVYVTNSGSGTLSVIDTVTNTVTTTVPVGNNPAEIVVTSEGKTVYVTNYGDNSVSEIDTSNNTVIATVPVGSQPWGVADTPDGTKVYVANNGGGTVSVIDASTNTVTATVPVGNSPVGVAVTPDGTKIYIANSGSNTISVIDATTNNVTAEVKVGLEPYAFGQFIGPKLVIPVANFSANLTSGYAPLAVQFRDLSANATEWNWDFGDGVSSADENPIHVYSAEGTYTVNLTVSNANSTNLKSTTINVLNASYCIFKSVIRPDENGDCIVNSPGDEIPYIIVVKNDGKINLTNVSVDDPMISLKGSSGDDNDTGVLNPGETWVYNGIYRLTQDDIANGNVNNTATVTCNELPGKSSSVNTSVDRNADLSIYKSFVGIDIAGDHIINKVGDIIQYQVAVKNNGNVDLSGITVNDPMVTLTKSSGDHNEPGVLNPGEIWVYTGNYTVTQKNLDNVGENGIGLITNTATVSCNEHAPESSSIGCPIILPRKEPIPEELKPVAEFSTNVTSGNAPLTVQFTDLSQNVASRSWDFNGDGIADSSDAAPSNTYTSPGTYTANLTVSNANGTNSKTVKINVLPTDITSDESSSVSHSSGVGGGLGGRSRVINISNSSSSNGDTSAVVNVNQSENNTTRGELNNGATAVNVEQTSEQKKDTNTLTKGSKKTPDFEIISGIIGLFAVFLYRRR